jgi:hypothetical protein
MKITLLTSKLYTVHVASKFSSIPFLILYFVSKYDTVPKIVIIRTSIEIRAERALVL